MAINKKSSRRDFLRLAALGSGSILMSNLLSGCRIEKIDTTETQENDGENNETSHEANGDQETEETGTIYTSVEAIDWLLEGNQRFASGSPNHPHRDADRRSQVLSRQNPFAAILTCSDSRVVPEIVFDQGIGDLFVIRTAGHVVDKVGLGSIQYAIQHLSIPLLVVLGHQNCGAVTAAIEGEEVPGHIASIVEKIKPAVEKAGDMEGNLLHNVIDIHVSNVVDELRTGLSEYLQSNPLEIIGMRYDLDSGVANFIYY